MFAPRSADIDRLLDPSYKLSPPTNFLTLCVDNNGDLHDPDYRHFPISTRASSPSRTKYYSSHSPIPFYDHDDQEDEPEDDFSLYYPNQTRPTRRSSAKYQSRSLISSPASSYSGFSSSPSSSGSSSSPTSPFDDSYSSNTSSPRKLQRHRHAPLPPVPQEYEYPSLFTAPPPAYTQEEDSYSPESDDLMASQEESLPERRSTPTPTCVEGLRMQWQSISYSVRFRVFRTKRSIRRRIFPQKTATG